MKIHIPTISEKSGFNVLLFLVRWKFFYTKCENEQWHSYIIFWYMECYKNLSAGLGKTSGGEVVRYRGGWVDGWVDRRVWVQQGLGEGISTSSTSASHHTLSSILMNYVKNSFIGVCG